MKKLTITSLQKYQKDAKGNDLRTTDGRPYERLVIRTQEYGERALSGFVAFWNKNWREGDVVEVEVEETAGRNGEKYLNLKKPDPLKALEARIEKVEAWIKAEIAKKPKEAKAPTPNYPEDPEEWPVF